MGPCIRRLRQTCCGPLAECVIFRSLALVLITGCADNWHWRFGGSVVVCNRFTGDSLKLASRTCQWIYGQRRCCSVITVDCKQRCCKSLQLSVNSQWSLIVFPHYECGQVAHASVFQRTAIWVSPKPDSTLIEHSLQRQYSLVRLLLRWLSEARFEAMTLGITNLSLFRPIVEYLQSRLQSRVKRHVADPDLARQLTPTSLVTIGVQINCRPFT